MKNASKILFLVGGIVSCVEALTYLIVGIVMIWFGTSEDIKNEMLKSYTVSDAIRDFGNGTTPADAVQAVQGLYVVLGVMFIIFIFLALANAILSFKARKSESKGLFIANIVFGFVSSCIINSVGGILAVIASNRDETLTE